MVAKGTMAVKQQPDDWLPTTSYVVLGLLSFGTRLTGYEIRQWALGSTRFFWSAPAMSQIYRELERLQGLGLVDELDESGDHERARTTYAVTPRGRRELKRWIDESPYEAPTIRHPVVLRLFLGHVADRDRLVELLEAQRDWADSVLADLRAVQNDLEGDERFEFPRAVASWGLDFYGTESIASGRAVEHIGRPRS